MTEKTKAFVRNKKLRDVRKKSGVTQDDIAEALGMTRSAYQHLEAKGNPTADILFKISRYLGCEMVDLIEDINSPSQLRESDNRPTFNKTLLSDDEKKVLEMFSALTPEDKARALGYLTGLSAKF